MGRVEQKIIIIKNYNHLTTQEPKSSYKYKQTNKYVFWGKGKEKLFHTIECQLVQVKVMTELENNHWSNIMVIIDLGKNHHCMLISEGQSDDKQYIYKVTKYPFIN